MRSKDPLIQQMKEEDKALLKKLEEESARTHKGFQHLKKRIKNNRNRHSK